MGTVVALREFSTHKFRVNLRVGHNTNRLNGSTPSNFNQIKTSPFSNLQNCLLTSLPINYKTNPFFNYFHLLTDSLQAEALCTYNNHSYTLNEEFRASDCRNCTCRSGGRLECITLQCPYCEVIAEHIEGQCCPICKGLFLPSNNFFFAFFLNSCGHLELQLYKKERHCRVYWRR